MKDDGGDRADPWSGPSRGARALLLAGSSVRIAYGLGALLAPRSMVDARLAPNTHGLPDPRLLLRGFGGHQLLVGSATLLALRQDRRLARCAAMLSLMVDTFDVGSAALEQRARGECDSTVAGGYAISGAGMLAFGLATLVLAA